MWYTVACLGLISELQTHVYVFEPLGRTLFSFKQNPFALPTFSVLPLFFLFCFFFSVEGL